ncbi:MAG: hypothetical protein AAF639_02800 [Chloroflexota bacterium]
MQVISVAVKSEESNQTVAEIDTREPSDSKFAQNWRKLNAIIREAMERGEFYKDEDDEEVWEVRNRWNYLKDRYLAEQKAKNTQPNLTRQ